MVLAEAVKLDAGTVVIFLLVVLAVLSVVVVVVATVGTLIGLSIGRSLLRRGDPEADPALLPPGSRAVLVVGAGVLTVASGWIGWVLAAAAPGVAGRTPFGVVVVAFVLPILWGIHNGRTRSFPPRNPARRPPDRPLGEWDRSDEP
jgi:hypothetical protein